MLKFYLHNFEKSGKLKKKLLFVSKTFKILLQTAEQNSYVLHTHCPWVSVIKFVQMVAPPAVTVVYRADTFEHYSSLEDINLETKKMLNKMFRYHKTMTKQ